MNKNDFKIFYISLLPGTKLMTHFTLKYANSIALNCYKKFHIRLPYHSTYTHLLTFKTGKSCGTITLSSKIFNVCIMPCKTQDLQF